LNKRKIRQLQKAKAIFKSLDSLFFSLEDGLKKSKRNKVIEIKEVIKDLKENYFLLQEIYHFDEFKLYKWAQEVKKVGKCDICGETENLSAHHLWSKTLHKSLAYQYDNGVCLCNKCHKAFHNKYNIMFQITPKTYEKFKNMCQAQIRLYGVLNYENVL